jgi:hypothetical protein
MFDRCDFMCMMFVSSRWAPIEMRLLTRKFLITAPLPDTTTQTYFDNRPYPGAGPVQMINQVRNDLRCFNLECYVEY